MKVILLKHVPKVGKKDEVVEVASGFAANSLFPRKLAIPATDSALANLKRSLQNKSAEKEIRNKLLDDAIKKIDGSGFIMLIKANKEGSLFSKIHVADIAKVLDQDHRVVIDPSCIIIPDGSIKKVGKYSITVKDDGYVGKFDLEIKAE